MQPMRYKEPKEPSKPRGMRLHQRFTWITSRNPPENYQRLNDDVPKYELFFGWIEETEPISPLHHPKPNVAYHEDDRSLGRLIKNIWYYPDSDCFYIETYK